MLAATISGLPSTAWAVATGGDPLAATRAAGTLLPGWRDRPTVAGGVMAHLVISAGWTAAFVAMSRWRRERIDVASGALAGAGIAAVDLAIVGRRLPAIAALHQPSQWADHVTFGVVLALALGPEGS